MRAQPRRELLINTAAQLFNENGYHATGIDRLLAESGVSKATLYKHFRSKDALILAILEKRQTEILGAARHALSSARGGSDSPLLAVFDFLHLWFQTPEFKGCLYIKACAEFQDPGHEIHRFAANHKMRMRALFEEHISAGDNEAAQAQSAAISLLVDGAIVNAQMHQEPASALRAKEVARLVLAS